MQNQGSVWLNIRRDRPDYIYLQGWGAMNPTAVARGHPAPGFPIENNDRRSGWAGATRTAPGPAVRTSAGYKPLSFNGPRAGLPFIDER